MKSVASNLNLTAADRHPLLNAAFLVLGFLVAGALAVHIAHVNFGFAPDHAYLIEEWAYNFVTSAAALAVLTRVLLRPADRLGWGLIGLGLAAWAGADIYWTLELSELEEIPIPSAADIGYYAGYLLILGGVVGLAHSRVRRMTSIEWTDVAIGALGVGAIGMTLLLDYVLENTTGTPTEIAVSISYPVFDLITMALAVAVLALTGWRPGRGLAFVIVGVACAGVADAIYTYESLAGTWLATDWYNSLWPLGTAILAAGALQPDPAHRISVRPQGWRSFASPAIFALVVFAFLLVDRLDTESPAAAGLTVLTLVAIVARLVLTFNENRRLVHLLKQDQLTRLGNRSKLVIDLERLFQEDKPRPHVLTILDLDGFKAYNDAFGHPAGDSVLIRLAHQLAEAVGDSGGAYRLGGDEFATLIPGDLTSSAPQVEVATRALSVSGEGFRITSSAGSAEVPLETAEPRAALQLADQRMYEQKDSRRPSPGGEVEAVLVRILQQRLPGRGVHGRAVAQMAKKIGAQLGMSEGERAALVRAAELHDVGKMAIPDAILSKPGPLSEEEWDFMRQHTILGERILTAAPSLAAVGGVVRSSHERWDGKGYPDGLAEDEIPLASRIVFACDAYDAMTSERPYAAARNHEDALVELRRCAGTMFDPVVVDILCGLDQTPRPTQVPKSAPAGR